MSLPKRAKFNRIIQDLFQNEVLESEQFKEYYTFSNLSLTAEQQQLLTYPEGLEPMNIFVLQQVDSYVGQNYSFSQFMASFVKKNDGFTYGYYFSLIDQPRFDRKVLAKSPEPIQLDPGVKFQADNLLEAYNNVNGLTEILSYGTTYATLQYSKDGFYYYEVLTLNGIQGPLQPPTKLIGLSKNLEKYVTDCH